MKKFFFLVMIVSEVAAQNQRDVWLGGANSLIDFSSGVATAETRPYITWAESWVDASNASICDKNGNLLFYTNGYAVFDRNFETMPNGDSLECGQYPDDLGYQFMPLHDGALIIPIPGDSIRYYLFYFDLYYYTKLGNTKGYVPNHLFYAVVDMSLNGGLGDVVPGHRDISLISDTLVDSGIHAIKHANGRDWWIYCHEYGNDNYFYFLIDPLGIHGPFAQSIGIKVDGEDAGIFSELKFSNSGSLAVQLFSDSNLVEIYYFDRCTGLFSNYQSLTFPDTFVDPAFQYGACFSTSERYLYLGDDGRRLYQFDVTKPDIQSTMTLIDTFDHAFDPFATYFGYMLRGPDGKIYMEEFNGNQSFHVINEPDSFGLACNFVKRAFALDSGTYWGGTCIPNLPNYDLGPLIGSECDTLTSTTNTKPQTPTFSLYPNPSSTYINIVYALEQNATLTFTDAYGRVAKQLTLYPYFKNRIINIDDLSEGVYVVTMQNEEERISKKVVVTR